MLSGIIVCVWGVLVGLGCPVSSGWAGNPGFAGLQRPVSSVEGIGIPLLKLLDMPGVEDPVEDQVHPVFSEHVTGEPLA